jgi:F-type H+-transporting ATPase subunit epsilon
MTISYTDTKVNTQNYALQPLINMPKTINLTITTPERIVFQDQVDEVVLPTPQGEIGILPNHLPLISLMSAGEIRVKKGEEMTPLAVSSGFIEVRNNQVTILADTAEKAEEIDEQRAQAGRERAQALMKERATDDVGLAGAQAALAKELARLKVARKKRKYT